MDLDAATATADALAPDPAARSASPDWGTVPERVLCPLCDYDLRGLVDPRCPECGYAFTWPELFDPELKVHPYLFEHHPRRNVRSFLRTLVGGLRPRRFWKSLRPTQPSRPRRLVLYWFLAAVLTLAGYVAHAAADFIPRARENEVSRRWQVARTVEILRRPDIPASYVNYVANMGGPQAVIDAAAPPWFTRRFAATWWTMYGKPRGNLLSLILLYLAWPWATFATLLIFNQSMRRAGVKRIHVLRCALYCCDAGLWLVPLVVAGVALLGGHNALDDGQEMLFLALALYGAVTTWRLAAAYRFYLRFHRPKATAFAAQLIVALFMLAVVLNIPAAWLMRP